MPPAISKKKADAAEATVADTDHDNDTDTTLTNGTIGRGAGLVLESKSGEQARVGDVLTDTILHR
jgi:hypothetical protein